MFVVLVAVGVGLSWVGAMMRHPRSSIAVLLAATAVFVVL